MISIRIVHSGSTDGRPHSLHKGRRWVADAGKIDEPVDWRASRGNPATRRQFSLSGCRKFSNELHRYGALSNVTYALSNNFGPPAAVSELTGNWRLIQVGATTTVTRGSNVYQRQEYAGLAGSMIISPNGTYVWNSPSGVLRGTWRRATPTEMSASDKGGEGVVLLNARSGGDWLVYRRNEEGPEGTEIMVTVLATRKLRQRGTR